MPFLINPCQYWMDWRFDGFLPNEADEATSWNDHGCVRGLGEFHHNWHAIGLHTTFHMLIYNSVKPCFKDLNGPFPRTSKVADGVCVFIPQGPDQRPSDNSSGFPYNGSKGPWHGIHCLSPCPFQGPSQYLPAWRSRWQEYPSLRHKETRWNSVSFT